MNPRRAKFFGIYLLSAGILQLGLYTYIALFSEWEEWVFYFDPRGGIFLVGGFILGLGSATLNLLRWASAILLFFIGLLWVSGRELVMTYVISEVLLSAPNVLLLFYVVVASADSDSGPSASDMYPVATVIMVFSIIPLTLVSRLRWREEPIVPLDIGRV